MMILLIEAGLLFAILFGIVWFITTKIRQFGLEKAVKHSLLVTFPLVFLAGPANYIAGMILALMIQIFIRYTEESYYETQ